jgi:hypothetical protein
MSGSGSGSGSGLSPSSNSGSGAAPSIWGMSEGDSGRCAVQATCLLHGGVTAGVSGVVSAIGTVWQLFLGVSGGLTTHGCSAEGGFETGVAIIWDSAGYITWSRCAGGVSTGVTTI